MSSEATTIRPPLVRGAGARRMVERMGLHELAMIPVLLVAVVVGALVSDAFLTTDNFVNILQQSSELSLLVIAEAIILIAGKFDLSLESVVAFAPMIGAWLVLPEATGGGGLGLPPGLGILAIFTVGAGIGVINGLLVLKLRLNAFIVTLAVLILLRGLTLGIASGETLYSLPSAYTWLGTASVLGIPVSVWLAGALFAAAGVFLRYHRLGRAVYAVGGNAEAARAAGVRVDRLVLCCFVLGGLLAALAGLMFSGRIASVSPAQGQNMIFTVFAAAVIGGISLNGGRGRIVGALTGVLLLGVISNVLTLSQIESYWIDASYGAIILVALILARASGAESEAG